VGIDVGAHAQATVAGLVGGGQVFEVRTAAEADALVRRLRAGGSPTVDAVRRLFGGDDEPVGDASLIEGGVDARLDVSLSAGEDAKLGATGGGESVLGRRVDRATGATTWYLRMDRNLPLFAETLLGSGSAELDGDALLAVTQDRDGRWRELSALLGGRAEAGVQVQEGPSARAGGTRWEAQATVGLDDPEVLAALRAWRAAPVSDHAVAGLGRALRDRARLDLRRYAREGTSDSDGVSGGAALRLALERGRSSESTRLVAASTRPPGGLWEQRLDCVG
jgi:hypothetical protein